MNQQARQIPTDPDALLSKSKSWPDFAARIETLPTKKAKGDAFERIVQLYLKLDPKYRTLLQNVWLYDEIPASVRRRLRLPPRDMGIDLLAQTRDREFWAVQAKYRSQSRQALRFADLSTFAALAFTSCRGISYGLVCTTTDRVPRQLEGLPDQLGFQTSEVWHGLGADFFRQVRALLRKRTPRPVAARPRPHQRRAIQRALTHYQKRGRSRGKLIQPCGTGKTLTAYWIADALGARTTLVAVPSLALVRQTLQAWLTQIVASGRERNTHWLCVCSDESTSKELDALTSYTHELGIPCETDPSAIMRWLRMNRRGARIIFTTYQSAPVLARSAKRAKVSFDFGVFDEAHRTVGSRSKPFAHLLSDMNAPIRRRLFMTATERRYAGSTKQILSMDDPESYGEDIEVLSFKRALEIRPRILSDYQVLIVGVSQREIAELVAKNVFVRPNAEGWSELEAEGLASVIALRKAMTNHPIRHAVSFHSSIRNAKEFCAHQDSLSTSLREYGQLSTFHVSSHLRASEREAELQDFSAATRALVTNARCLTEGVDLPNIDGILFADPKKSRVDIVQAVGRALRPAPGKRMGFIVIPLFLQENCRISDLRESGAFRDVLIILRALASNDDRIIEYLQAISRGRRPRVGRIVSDVDPGIIGTEIDLSDFAAAIELIAWEHLGSLAWMEFSEARLFVQNLGLRSRAEWSRWWGGRSHDKPKRPSNMPATPDRIYADSGWRGWGDWLGTGRRRGGWRDFKDARRFSRALGLGNRDEWLSWCRGDIRGKPSRPSDIPTYPTRVYAGRGWRGWGDWLGSARRVGGWRDFAAARRFVRGLKLNSQAEWKLWLKGELRGRGSRPFDIPAAPNTVYAGRGWKDWSDWLGTARRQGGWRDFTDARDFARRLRLKNHHEWARWARGKLPGRPRKPADIPASPGNVYSAKGWAGWGDWLGTGARQGGWREFSDARRYARSLKLKGSKEWYLWTQGKLSGKPERPVDIPIRPDAAYAKLGWIHWNDWLGAGQVRNVAWRDFAEARRFARRLRSGSIDEWKRWCRGEVRGKPRKPADLPSSADTAYADKGWVDWQDFLGTERRRGGWREFADARRFALKLRLRNTNEWRRWAKGELRGRPKKPSDIPASPDTVYARKGWVDWGDFLGTGRRVQRWRDFAKARRFARRLRLGSVDEWKRWCRGEVRGKPERPLDIPKKPDSAYSDLGWVSWSDWLGTKVRRRSK